MKHFAMLLTIILLVGLVAIPNSRALSQYKEQGSPEYMQQAIDGKIQKVAWNWIRQLIAIGTDAGIWIYDENSHYIDRLETPSSYSVDALAWSHDGNLLAASTGWIPTGTYIWEAEDFDLIQEIPNSGDLEVAQNYTLSWNPESTRLAIPIGSRAAILDISNGERVLATQEGHTETINSVSWNSDGTKLATISADHTARIWDVSSGDELDSFELESSSISVVWDVAWSPNDRYLSVSIMSNEQTGEVQIWDIVQREKVTTLQNPEIRPSKLIWRNDRIFALDYNFGTKKTQIAVWNTADYGMIGVIDSNGEEIVDFDVNADGSQVVYTIDQGEFEIVLVPLVSPSELIAEALTTDKAQLTWFDNSTDETNFRIERSPNGTTDWTQIATVPTGTTSYTDENLEASTAYYYRVRAYRSSDNQYSEYTNVASVLTAPAAPLNVTALAVPSGKVNLSWQDESSDETSFRIERSPDENTDWVEINTIPADTTAYEDSGLTPSTTYWYRVRAHRESDNQFSEYTPSVSVLTAPADPSQVTATLSAPNQIQISWTDNSTDESGFRIERSPDSTAWEEIGTATATTTYTDSTTNPSTTYYYRVRAYRGSDNVFSDYSTASSGILSSPATPAGFAGVPLPINKAKLMWTDNTLDETNFRLERSDNGTSGWSEIATVPANQATYTETRTNCIQTSYYRIRAYRGSDNQYSAYSPVVSVTTDGCGPDRLALFNTVHTHNRRFTEFPGTTYNDFWLNAPVGSGQWFMGDWDGDGIDTPAVFINGTYWYTNSQAASSTWTQINVQANEYPVVGRFDLSVGHDCLGVVDSIVFPPTTTFMLGYTCNLTGGTTPSLAYQWLGGILPDDQFTGDYQFVSGDWNGDGVDTIAARRSEYIAYTNVAPGQNGIFDQAQYFGNPYNGQYGGLYGALVAGDWNYDGLDTFGYFYVDGNFYWRNHLQWNQPISGSALISNPYGTNVLPTTWRN